MVMQAAWDINYIHEKGVLHRDIASRNCLYGGGNVKIADFGLSREGTSFQMRAHQRVPIKWIAPETITTAMFTQKTDVWSFGLMAWEIYNQGIKPYLGMMVAEVAVQVRQGYRMEFPSAVRGDVVEFMKEDVWNGDANTRPIMLEVVKKLEALFGMTFAAGKSR